MIYLWRLKSWIKAKIKRITATTSKTAIAILSAAIIAFVASVSVFKSVRFFSLEHPGILIVVVAVAGEVICDWNRKKTLKERLKKFFGILLVSGLLLEISEAVKSDEKSSSAYLEAKLAETNSANSYERAADAERESGQANERAAITESNNLVLQAKVLELEAKIQPRTITPVQRDILMKMLRPVDVNEEINFVYSASSNEQKQYAEILEKILESSGFKLKIDVGFGLLPPMSEGLTCGVKGVHEYPANAAIIQNAFNAADIPCAWIVDNSVKAETNMTIWVGSKPTLP